MEHSARDRINWRSPVTLLATGYLVYLLRYVLIPFALSFMLAYIFTPVVDRLQRYLRLPRILCVLLLFLVFGIPSYFVVAHNRPILEQNIQELAENAPQHLSHFLTNLFGRERISLLGQTLDARTVAQQIIARTQVLPESPRDAVEVGWTVVNIIMYTILTGVVLFYFLVGGKGLMRSALAMVPGEKRERVQRLIFRVDALFGRYLRGLALVVLFAATVVWVAFRFFFHIPYAPFFAVTVGLLELVPLFGPIASGVLTSLTALTQGDLVFTFKVVLFYLGLRFTIDQVVGPMVLGNAVTISPVAVIFAFLAGGSLYGFLGLLVAVPVTAVFKIVLEERNTEKSV